jgi:uncharacterized protein YpmS
MEITFVWSWFSFVVGALSSVVAAFILALVFSFKQWKKQKQRSEELSKTFDIWSSRETN